MTGRPSDSLVEAAAEHSEFPGADRAPVCLEHQGHGFRSLVPRGDGSDTSRPNRRIGPNRGVFNVRGIHVLSAQDDDFLSPPGDVDFPLTDESKVTRQNRATGFGSAPFPDQPANAFP